MSILIFFHFTSPKYFLTSLLDKLKYDFAILDESGNLIRLIEFDGP